MPTRQVKNIRVRTVTECKAHGEIQCQTCDWGDTFIDYLSPVDDPNGKPIAIEYTAIRPGNSAVE